MMPIAKQKIGKVAASRRAAGGAVSRVKRRVNSGERELSEAEKNARVAALSAASGERELSEAEEDILCIELVKEARKEGFIGVEASEKLLKRLMNI